MARKDPASEYQAFLDSVLNGGGLPQPEMQPVPRNASFDVPSQDGAISSTVSGAIKQRYGLPQELGLDAIKAAQDEAKKKKAELTLAEAAGTLGSAIAGVKPQAGIYEPLKDQADESVKNLAAQRDIALRDQRLQFDQDRSNEDRQLKAQKSARDSVFDAIKLRESIRDKADDRSLRERELKSREALRREALQANKETKMAPEDRAAATTLASANAKKEAIANQIDANLEGWDSLSENDKLARGRSMLKILNSTEGADAIGAEEARRLGAKLEFAYGNLFNDNPTQFGRDLEGFKTEAAQNSDAIRKAINMNAKQLEKITGRESKLRSEVPAGVGSPQTKVIGGVTYEKVPGGWKKQVKNDG